MDSILGSPNSQAGEAPAPAELAGQRSGLYGILSQVFLKEMSPALLAALRAPELAAALADLGLDPAAALGEAPDGQVLEELAVEYAGLFLGPGPHIPPYESVHVDPDARTGRSSLYGEPAVRMRRLAEEEGLEISKALALLPDHVAVELEYMQRLALAEAERWQTGDLAGAMAARAKQRAFLDQHLCCWLPVFATRVAQGARLPFYRQMAELAAAFAAEDRQLLTEPIGQGYAES